MLDIKIVQRSMGRFYLPKHATQTTASVLVNMPFKLVSTDASTALIRQVRKIRMNSSRIAYPW